MEELLRGHFYHVYIKRKPDVAIFRDQHDYVTFLHTVRQLKHHHGLELNCFCLLPDHYHLIMGVDLHEAPGTIKGSVDLHPLKTFLNMLHFTYNQHMKRKYSIQNNLIEHEVETILIDSTEAIKTFTCYLHYHPEREHLIKDSKDWKHSSLKIFLDNFEGDEERIINPRFFYEHEEYERFFKDYLFEKEERDKLIEYLVH